MKELRASRDRASETLDDELYELVQHFPLDALVRFIEGKVAKAAEDGSLEGLSFISGEIRVKIGAEGVFPSLGQSKEKSFMAPGRDVFNPTQMRIIAIDLRTTLVREWAFDLLQQTGTLDSSLLLHGGRERILKNLAMLDIKMTAEDFDTIWVSFSHVVKRETLQHAGKRLPLFAGFDLVYKEDPMALENAVAQPHGNLRPRAAFFISARESLPQCP